MTTSQEQRVKPKSARFSEIRQRVRDGDVEELEFLPLLGRNGYVFKGYSHIIAAYPKVGKSTLIHQAIKEWPDEQVLYFSEEGIKVWERRAHDSETKFHDDDFDNLQIEFALGMSPERVLQRIQYSRNLPFPPTVVVIDTIRSIIMPEDENDNAKVIAALKPFCDMCEQMGMTLIMLHHIGKNSKESPGGRGIVGASAFLAIVDVGLEIYPVGNMSTIEGSRTQRIIGTGRLDTIFPLTYGKDDTERLIVLDSQSEVDLMRERTADVVGYEWQTTNEVLAKLPGMTRNRVLLYLKGLAMEGVLEREPPISVVDTSGYHLKWRRSRY